MIYLIIANFPVTIFRVLNQKKNNPSRFLTCSVDLLKKAKIHYRIINMCQKEPRNEFDQ